MDESTASSAATKAASQAAPQGGVKETIESILIAFILAFIFRAFVVEAFVIPTGSMAPTLLGAHIRETCEDCGWVYDVNVSSPTSQMSDDPQVPPRIDHPQESICPNCAYINESPAKTPVRYGDRILVLKYLDVLRQFGLIEHPRRWDVAVFKTPFKAPYQQNYIKRLVGLPGESVLILDGDIYTAPSHSTDISQFRIQRKHDEAQEALWRIVYDNDHLPRGRDAGRPPGAGETWTQPWKLRSGSGWQLGTPDQPTRRFIFDGTDTRGTIHFDRDANRPASPRYSNMPLTDWLAYDVSEPRYRGSLRPYVSDLKLDLHYQRNTGDGPLELKLTKRDDTFVAQLLPDRVRLLRSKGPDEQEVLAEKSMTLPIGRRVHLEFSNYDYQVQLKIDREVVLATTQEQYAPDVQQLLAEYQAGDRAPAPMIEISAAEQSAEITHLSLWRDIFYINEGDGLIWGVPRSFPDHVIHLSNQPGSEEYFVLGDNSPISLDGRYWENAIQLPAENLEVGPGRVPQRFMLGKAFFVYWPAGYPLLQGGPSLVPNFGEMRFIH